MTDLTAPTENLLDASPLWTDNESYLRYQTANCIDEHHDEGDFEVEPESKEARHKRLTGFEGLDLSDLDF